MNRITTARDLEAIIGHPPALVLAKELPALDDAARHVLATAPVAGFGHLDADGRPHTTLVGGRPGFAEPVSPTTITIPADVHAEGPVSFVFLIPGVGETLRLNGTVAARTPGRLAITVEQVYIHCARAILRSRLWETASPAAAATPITDGPLSGPRVAGFLAAAPFLIVSTWDGAGGDTSPRGDLPGFVRVLDGRTLAIPDRRGNKRADTAHNLLADTRISAALLVPGRTEALHISGTAHLTDDPALLADMALGGAVPQTALIVTVASAQVKRNAAIAAGRIWDPAGHADADTARTLTALSVRQIGEMKPALRRLGRPLSALARPIQWMLDRSYRRALKSEGYGDGATRRPGTPVRVRRVIRETRAAVTLELAGADTTFLPGQFYTLIVEIDGREVRRAYSATSIPGAQPLTLTVKRDGLCSSYLNDRVRAGARMRVLGPSGTFHVAEPAARGAQYVLIAAGSGITPMMSIIRTVLASSPDATITLLYGNRTEADIIFARQLAALVKAHPDRLAVHHVLSRPGPGWRGRTGRIGPDLLGHSLGHSERAHYYVCGPAGLLTSVRETLTALGVPPRRLHEERFAAAPAAVETTAQTMTVEGVGEVVVAAGQTLLDAGLAAGVPMPYSCTVGSCGECKVRLLRGEVKTTDGPGLAPGEILACVSRPLTETTIATP